MDHYHLVWGEFAFEAQRKTSIALTPRDPKPPKKFLFKKSCLKAILLNRICLELFRFFRTTFPDPAEFGFSSFFDREIFSG